jgi:alpha-beta hydrolase superfamily lysophospholipase
VTFPLLVASLFTLATLLITALVGGALAWAGRATRRFWRNALLAHAGLFLLHAFATFPIVLGWLGAHGFVGTRPDERTYAGPRIGADGALVVQSWDSLKAEAKAGGAAVDATVAAAAAARARAIPSSDGVTLRAFRVEAKQEPPAAVAVLVHGLFRSAMEVEPVAAMLREQGCECWLVEMRNFGGSGKAPFTVGVRESDDVVAAVQFVRAQPGRAHTPLVLFGVSFGTVAIGLALPRIEHVAGLVLDAPIDDMLPAAHRLLDLISSRRPLFRIDEPWQSLVLRSLEYWSGIDLAHVCPADVLATLPHDIPVLVIGAGQDDRAPPATVERLFARLPMHDDNKQLWMVADSSHGHVFLDQPAAYAEHLRWLLGRLRR